MPFDPSTSSAPPLLSVVVPCMGRLHHLQLTAPVLLAQPEIQYILVDYSCPDRCGDYARTHWPRAQVVEVPGERYFNKPRALNAGVRAATGRWLVTIDADNLVRPDFARVILSLVGDQVLLGHRHRLAGAGFVVCHPRAYDLAGGSDERFAGWGPEDLDLRERLLRLGLKLRLVPDDLIQVLDHADAERVGHYPEKNKKHSDQQLRRLLRFRLPLEFRYPWPELATFGVPGPGWLRVWKTVQYAHHIRRVLGSTVRLYPYWDAWRDGRWHRQPQADCTAQMRAIDASLVGDAPLEIVRDLPPEQVSRYCYRLPWHFPLTPTRARWQGWTKTGPRRLACHLDGAGAVGLPACLPSRLPFAFPHEVRVLPAHWPLPRLAAAAADCDAYVGLDSAVTQLCYAVGVPVFLLTGALPPEKLLHRHGDRHGIWCADLDEFCAQAAAFLDAAPSQRA